MTVPALKICGITRRMDSEGAAEAGARYLGAVFAAESPRVVTVAAAIQLFSGLSPSRVGVFVNGPPATVIGTAGVAELDVVQLHGEESEQTAAEIRAAGNWSVWKAVRVRAADDLDRAVDRFGSTVDGLLVDAWSAAARGGTGESFDWDAIAGARERVPAHLTFVVAGGLRADNVARAVGLLRPDAIDVSSGVESAPGIKDRSAIDTLIQVLRETS